MKRAICAVLALILVYVGLCAVDYYGSGEARKALLAAGKTGTLTVREAPAPANDNGVITAQEWAAVYPEITASLQANADNTYRISYLEEDPYLTTVYAGFGFAKDYGSAIGHSYTLADVAETKRPHPLANCLTCKTPDYTKLVNDLGDDAYSLDFNEVLGQMHENVSCYNCHGNDAGNKGELVVTHSYVTEALGSEMDKIAPAVLSCGQCHIEYYFKPENKATAMPYDSVAAMSPEAILAYYDAMDFADWTQEATGTRLLKAQHPEMETFLGEGSAHKGLLTCADCHMADTVEGKVYYTSHKLESPLENPALLDTCAKCHGSADMTAVVRGIQAGVTAREKEVGQALKEFNDALAAKTSAGVSDEDLAEVRGIYRSAQWYWDFCYVENAEGAHNSKLAYDCLDKAAALIEQGMALLK